MANIEFKGFKLVNADGWSIKTILANATEAGVLYLVRTNADNADYKDGYLILNGKVYGSAEGLRASMEEQFDTLSKNLDDAFTAITGNTGTIYTKITEAINKLDATVETSGTTYISGTIVETDGKLTSFNINEKGLTDKFTEIDNAIKKDGTIDGRIDDAVNGMHDMISDELVPINENIGNISGTVNTHGTLIGGLQTSVSDITKQGGAIDLKINALNANVSGISTNGSITVKVDQANGKLTGVTVTDTLGTAAKANVLATESTISGATGVDNNLVSVKQVTDYVTDRVANLTGAMHFEGKKEKLPENNAGYESGDVILVGTKEYVYDGTEWVELGDEGIYLTIATAESDYVKKTTTIAGVNLQDNITKKELLAALNVADDAQVNVLEGVQVNGSPLTIDSGKTVDITIAESSNNGKITVNGADVAVHGLGSAAYTNSDAYDVSGTATAKIAEISGTTSGTSTNSYITVATTQENGKVTGITVNDSALKTAITNLDNAAVKNVNGETGNTITLTGANIAVGADVDGAGEMNADKKVSEVLADIYTKLNTANANAYTGITAADGDHTVIVTPTTHGHSVAVNLKQLSPDEKASGLIQLVSAEDGSGIYGKLFFDGEEKKLLER